MIRLFAFAWALLPAIALAEAKVGTDFSAETSPIQSDAPERISGELPASAKEDSAWADVEIRYEQQSDRLGSDRKWIRATVSNLKQGRAQLKWMLPPAAESSAYRLVTTLASETGSRVTFKVMDAAPPYTIHWEQSIGLNPARETRTFDFQLPRLDSETALILAMEKGQIDLHSVELTRQSAAELERQRKERVANAPDNLAPQVSFPFGIPTGWTSDRVDSFAGNVVISGAEEPAEDGTYPLVVDVQREGAEFTIYSAPFTVADPEQIHVVSFIATGEGEGRLRVYADSAERGSGKFTATPEGNLAKVPFRPDPTAKWHVLRWEGSDDVQLRAVNISMGRQAKPFSFPKQAEVGLAAAYEQADVFVEGIQEPTIRYAVSGNAYGATLHSRTVDLYGREALGDGISITADNSRGEIAFQNPASDFKYGSFRTEAWLERDGEKISPVAEVVFHRVPKPHFWGRIAPESRFGNHVTTYEPHLYAVKATGANWNRMHGGNAENVHYWGAVEPEKGKWVWPKENLQKHRDAGFAICGVWALAPHWARIARTEPHMNGWLDNWWQPRDYEEFAEYVRQSTTNLEGLVDAWQIWNEPWGEFWFKEWREDLEGSHRWHPGETPEEDYVELSRVAWEAFQETGVDVPVLGVSATFGERGKKWMQKMLDLDAVKYSDVITFHAYFGGDLSLATRPETELLVNLERRVFDPIEKTPAAAEMPIWLTEGSWLTRDTDTGLHHHVLPGEKDPLDLVRDNCVRPALYHAVQFQHGTDKVFTYSINAGPAFYHPIAQGQHNWGAMVMKNGELHPAGVAYAAMAQRFEKATFARHLQLDDQTVAFIFNQDDGSGTLAAIFGPDLKDRIAKLESVDGLKLADFLGNPIESAIINRLVYCAADGQSVEDLAAILAPPTTNTGKDETIE